MALPESRPATLPCSEDHTFFLTPESPSALSHAPVDLELVETQEVGDIHKHAVVVSEVRAGMIGSEHTEVFKTRLHHTEIHIEQSAANALPPS